VCPLEPLVIPEPSAPQAKISEFGREGMRKIIGLAPAVVGHCLDHPREQQLHFIGESVHVRILLSRMAPGKGAALVALCGLP